MSNVCVWEEYTPMDMTFHRYTIKCDKNINKYHQTYSKTDYKFCPYCGRKIVIKED